MGSVWVLHHLSIRQEVAVCTVWPQGRYACSVVAGSHLAAPLCLQVELGLFLQVAHRYFNYMADTIDRRVCANALPFLCPKFTALCL